MYLPFPFSLFLPINQRQDHFFFFTDSTPIAWMLFWNSSNLTTAHAFVTINSLTQLYYLVARLQPMDTSSTSSVLTHIVSKTFAGIGVLDFLHNGSVAFFEGQAPSLAVKVLTGVGFLGAGAVSDWIFGGCLILLLWRAVRLAIGVDCSAGMPPALLELWD
jgi:hypothetical protein